MTTSKEEQKHTDLLPCPFCGAAGDQIHKSAPHIITKWVYCTQCGASSRSSPNEFHDAAIAAWNTRKADCHEELVKAATALGLNYNYCCDGAEVVVFAGGDEVIYHGDNKDGAGNGKAFKAIKDFTDALARALLTTKSPPSNA